VDSGIERCLEIVEDEKDITLDVILLDKEGIEEIN